MKTNSKSIPTAIYVYVLLSIFLSCKTSLISQDVNTLTKSYKNEVIVTVTEELKNRYVFPDIAEKISISLSNKNNKGHYNQFDQIDSFLTSLNEDIYEICKDKHITISLKTPSKEQHEVDVDWIQSKLEDRTFYRRYNANFKTIEKLEENIGYLDLRGFYSLDYGRKYADYAMGQLASSDAIIIDLRKNSGGRRDMVDYLLSYFFEDQIITGLSRKRTGENFIDREHKTPILSNKTKLTDMPVFILTSNNTFSAAEAFSYPMQVYDRATFIGETTKGGGNAGDLISINEDLQIFIPDVAALPHPISKTTFEGKGIIPDIRVNSERALEEAIKNAQIAAEKYKERKDQDARAAIISLNEIVSNYDGKNDELIIDAYLKCRDHYIIFEEWELNSLGYQFIRNDQLPTALAIFKTNTLLYPYSANVFDSYAEALVSNNNQAEAIRNYEQAIKIAKKNKDSQLPIYIENLNKIKN